MAVDLKKISTKVINAIKKDPTLITSFTKDPVSTIEKVTGVDLPNDQINEIIKQVKAQTKNIDMNDVANLVGALTGAKKTSTKKTTTTKKTTSKKDADLDLDDLVKGAQAIGKLLKK